MKQEVSMYLLPTQMLQDPAPTQKIREESGSHPTGVRDRALLDLTTLLKETEEDTNKWEDILC